MYLEIVMEKAKSLDPTPDVHACDLDDRETKRDERRLRHWVVKVFVLCFAFIVVLTTGSVLYAYVVRGDSLNDSIINTFMHATTEIIKFMVTPMNDS